MKTKKNKRNIFFKSIFWKNEKKLLKIKIENVYTNQKIPFNFKETYDD